jgi:hypothetical protein
VRQQQSPATQQGGAAVWCIATAAGGVAAGGWTGPAQRSAAWLIARHPLGAWLCACVTDPPPPPHTPAPTQRPLWQGWRQSLRHPAGHTRAEQSSWTASATRAHRRCCSRRRCCCCTGCQRRRVALCYCCPCARALLSAWICAAAPGRAAALRPCTPAWRELTRGREAPLWRCGGDRAFSSLQL